MPAPFRSIAGALTSFALGGLAFAAAGMAEARPALAAILRYLAVVNIGDLQWATRVASHAGSIVGMVLIGLGILRGFARVPWRPVVRP